MQEAGNGGSVPDPSPLGVTYSGNSPIIETVQLDDQVSA
jgi:hypothetical protein